MCLFTLDPDGCPVPAILDEDMTDIESIWEPSKDQLLLPPVKLESKLFISNKNIFPLFLYMFFVICGIFICIYQTNWPCHFHATLHNSLYLCLGLLFIESFLPLLPRKPNSLCVVSLSFFSSLQNKKFQSIHFYISYCFRKTIQFFLLSLIMLIYIQKGVVRTLETIEERESQPVEIS